MGKIKSPNNEDTQRPFLNSNLRQQLQQFADMLQGSLFRESSRK